MHAVIYIGDRSVRLDVDGEVLRRESEVRLTLEDPGRVASEITALLGDREIRSTVMLVLPSSWCYVHPITLQQRRTSHAMLAYALEEFLPVDADGLTCEFVPTETGMYVGFAIPTAPMRQLLDSLAEAGVVPDQVLVDAALGPVSATVWADEHHVSICDPKAGKIRVVRWPGRGPDVDRAAQIREILESDCAATEAEPVHVTGLWTFEQLTQLAGAVGRSEIVEPSIPTAVAFDLGRGVLAPVSGGDAIHRLLNRTLACVAVALTLLLVGLVIHRQRIDVETERITAWERSVYAELFPNQKPPAGIATRIASERRRLEALTRVPTESGHAPEAMKLLRDVVAAIPRDVRVDIQSLRIENGDVTMRGRTLDHAQAECIGQAVNALESVDCDPVRTDRNRDVGVQFFLHAGRPQAASEPRRLAERKP